MVLRYLSKLKLVLYFFSKAVDLEYLAAFGRGDDGIDGEIVS